MNVIRVCDTRKYCLLINMSKNRTGNELRYPAPMHYLNASAQLYTGSPQSLAYAVPYFVDNL